MALAESIRIVRQKSFLSQEDFAKALCVSLSTVNRWETGRAKPNLAAMKSLKAFCEKNGLCYSDIETEWLTAERYTKKEK